MYLAEEGYTGTKARGDPGEFFFNHMLGSDLLGYYLRPRIWIALLEPDLFNDGRLMVSGWIYLLRNLKIMTISTLLLAHLHVPSSPRA